MALCPSSCCIYSSDVSRSPTMAPRLLQLSGGRELVRVEEIGATEGEERRVGRVSLAIEV